MSIQKMREDIGVLAKQLVYIERIRQAENAPGRYQSERRANAERILKVYLENYSAVVEVADRRTKQ